MKCLRTGPVSEYMNDSADSCIVAHDDMKLQFFSADFFYGDKTLLLPHLVKSNAAADGVPGIYVLGLPKEKVFYIM